MTYLAKVSQEVCDKEGLVTCDQMYYIDLRKELTKTHLSHNLSKMSDKALMEIWVKALEATALESGLTDFHVDQFEDNFIGVSAVSPYGSYDDGLHDVLLKWTKPLRIMKNIPHK
jgi:hypothetical protein